jgi:lipopolysaccharide transport system permease protein
MTGNICWTFFSATLQATSSTFITNSNIMGKVYYPRMVTPISTVFSNLISFGIQFVMLVVFWTFYLIKGDTTIVVTGQLILIPFVVLEMSILSLGFGMIISSVTTKYRDLQMLVGFGLQLWQYACPIAYGLALIPQKFLPIYLLNPMTSVITTFRYAMFGFGYFSISYYLLGWGISLVVFFVGMILFSKVERTFMDTI